MKYTKGPWFPGTNSDTGEYIITNNGIIVAETYPDNHQDFTANAHLIAAAPDLLDSLEECLARIELMTTGICLDEKDTARIIIKQAKGLL